MEFEDGTRIQGIKAASRIWKGKEIDSPVEPPKECSTANIFMMSNLQNIHKKVNLCDFKLLSLW